MTISSAKIWDKVLCVIFPQIITHASVLTKYELIGNVYISSAINYIEQKCNISYKPPIIQKRQGDFFILSTFHKHDNRQFLAKLKQNFLSGVQSHLQNFKVALNATYGMLW